MTYSNGPPTSSDTGRGDFRGQSSLCGRIHLSNWPRNFPREIQGLLQNLPHTSGGYCGLRWGVIHYLLQGGHTVRCARAVRKVGHSPPPVRSLLGVGLPQGTIAIVYPCSINPPPSCVYVPLQTGTLRPVYGDTFSGCLPRGIIFCSHFSHPLLHSPWTLMLEMLVFYTRSNGVRVPATVVVVVHFGWDG